MVIFHSYVSLPEGTHFTEPTFVASQGWDTPCHHVSPSAWPSDQNGRSFSRRMGDHVDFNSKFQVVFNPWTLHFDTFFCFCVRFINGYNWVIPVLTLNFTPYLLDLPVIYSWLSHKKQADWATESFAAFELQLNHEHLMSCQALENSEVRIRDILGHPRHVSHYRNCVVGAVVRTVWGPCGSVPHSENRGFHGFPKSWGYPNSWMVEILDYKWMIWGSLWIGNLQIVLVSCQKWQHFFASQ